MGNKLIVSYTIAWDDDRTYNKLREDLHDAIIDKLASSKVWLETTSFYVIETDENSHQLCTRVAKAAKLRANKDKLLVININQKGGAAWGDITDPDIYSLLPFVKKL